MTAPTAPDEIFDGGLEEPFDQPMSEREVQSVVSQLVNDSITFIDSELSPERATATDYYKSRPFGDEEKGRSQVVSSDVRDAVLSLMPSLMKIFFGPEKMVEYRARRADAVPMAEQATEYINYIVNEDNNGFEELYSAFKDALVRRHGIIKFWWEEESTESSERLTGVSLDQLVFLQEDPEITAVAAAQETDEGDPNPFFTVDVTRLNRDGRVRIAALPPEEWIFSRSARNRDDALMMGHRKDMRRSELIAMGIDEDVLNEHGQASTDALRQTEDAISRQPNQITVKDERFRDESMALIEYIEAYVFIDVDGDGIAEHRKITTIGPGRFVVTNEPWSGRPFAIFQPDPEPHTMVGLSIADFTADIQRVKSVVLRGMLDSLSFALHPRTVAVEGQVQIADVLNTEIGAIIRERQPNMVREFAHTFVGAQALPIMELMDSLKEDRTGVSKAAAGLNPDALQSSTRAAVAATVSGGAERREMLARLFAETGMKQLFTGILELVIQNQDRARTVRLNGNYVEVDPRSWTATMDVTVNVALGVSLTDDRIAALMATAQKQQELLQTLGPNNPIVTLGQFRNTMAKIVELEGFEDTSNFFKPLPIDFEPPPPPPAPPDPATLIAQAEVAKVEAELEMKRADLALKEMEIKLREDRERDRNEADAFLRAMDLETKSSAAAIAGLERIFNKPRPGVANAQPATPPVSAPQIPGPAGG